jgi:hypothetical protein
MIGEASGTRATKSEEEIDGQSENKEEVQGEVKRTSASGNRSI